jgi:beta-lactamase regulating signal transducer with metallopeptidase domain
MIIYLIKTLLCAAVMFLIYFLFLEREKMHRFNRFYLLFSIVFSLTVSFITIKTPSPVITVNELIAPSGVSKIVATLDGSNKPGQNDNAVKSKTVVPTDLSLKTANTQVPVEKTIPWSKILLGVYIAVTTFLFLRFIRNLSLLLFTAARSNKVSYHGATLVLTKDNALPHSFLNYIFIDMEKFEQGTVEKEILQHELTHVNQRHSIDILLVEFVMIFSWVNPLLFLFRKAIMLNHEYLADEAVVTTFNNTDSYRLLLFNTVSQSNNLVLSSPFNYLTTKKRLIMMTRNTSRKVAILKQIALIPLIAVIGFLLSTRVIAQDIPKQQTTQKQTTSNKVDAPQSVIKEYFAIFAKYKVDTLVFQSMGTIYHSKEELDNWYKKTHIDTLSKIPVAEKNRLGDLFSQMSSMQQKHACIYFLPKPELRKKIVPTKEEFEAWKNSKVFGIWIDSTRVNNSVLNTHSNTDYAYFETFKMGPTSARIVKCKVKIMLLTEATLEKENKRISYWRSMESSRYMIAMAPHILVSKTNSKKTK